MKSTSLPNLSAKTALQASIVQEMENRPSLDFALRVSSALASSRKQNPLGITPTGKEPTTQTIQVRAQLATLVRLERLTQCHAQQESISRTRDNLSVFLAHTDTIVEQSACRCQVEPAKMATFA